MENWRDSPLAAAHEKRFGKGAGYSDDYRDIVARAYADRGGLAQAARDDDRRVGRVVMDWNAAQRRAQRSGSTSTPKTRRASSPPPLAPRPTPQPSIATTSARPSTVDIPLVSKPKRKLLRTLYSFAIDPELLLELRKIKALDGISESEQLRRGARLWIQRWGQVRGVDVPVHAGKLGESVEPPARRKVGKKR